MKISSLLRNTCARIYKSSINFIHLNLILLLTLSLSMSFVSSGESSEIKVGPSAKGLFHTLQVLEDSHDDFASVFYQTLDQEIARLESGHSSQAPSALVNFLKSNGGENIKKFYPSGNISFLMGEQKSFLSYWKKLKVLAALKAFRKYLHRESGYSSSMELVFQAGPTMVEVTRLADNFAQEDLVNHASDHGMDGDMSVELDADQKGNSCSYKTPNPTGFKVELEELTGLSDNFSAVVRDTLSKVNIVANDPQFLAAVGKKSYWGVSAATVLNYINRGVYKLKLGGRSMGSRVTASAGVCSNYFVLNTSKQDRFGSDLGGTLFHEITHNLGFLHSSQVPYPLGDLMRQYYRSKFGE